MVTRSRGGAPALDWRAEADPGDLREYDAFGPWIEQVRSPIAMPRIFRPYYDELAGSRFLLKIPRDIERVRARPGMNLYRAVLAVSTERLCLLDLDGAGVRRRDVDLAEVVATNTYVNLLIGRWSLLLADGTSIDLDYNTVGQAAIADVDGFVRTAAPATGLPSDIRPVPVRDHFFLSMLAAQRSASDDPVVPIHVEEPGLACRDERDRRRVGTGVMVLATPVDLVIVNRDEPARPRFRWANYASNTLAIPWSRMNAVNVVTPGQPERFGSLEVHAGSWVIGQPCLTRPDAVGAAVAGLGLHAPSGRAPRELR